MAEKLSHTPEHHKHTPEQHHSAPEQHHHTPERHHHRENIAEIRHNAEHHAKSAHESQPQDESNDHAPKEHFVNFEIKNLAYNRTMTRVRKQLSPVGRMFSKVIHQPVVDAVSEGVGKTVGRPSGILGGGLVALAGTTTYYYIAKHYGYDYNFGVFLLLLAAGFVAGWVGEYLLRTMHGSK
jgi:hypothetical protein